MVKNNTLVLLAPRILSDRKPLEDSNFIGLYTAIDDEDSKGFIYLVYKYANAKQLRYLKDSLENTEHFYNTRLLHVGDTCCLLFVFYFDDVKYIESYKEFGNIGFSLDDYALIYTFWGDLSKDIANLHNQTILECKQKLNTKDLSKGRS